MEELKICKDNYIEAEVTVLARSEDEALTLLEKDGRWNIHDLRQIHPEVVPLEQPSILCSSVR